jgi:hypothetical protein
MSNINLNVGIHTESAKKSLRELKDWIKREVRDVAIGIDEKSVINPLKLSLQNHKFKLGFDTKDLRAQVENELKGLTLQVGAAGAKTSAVAVGEEFHQSAKP